MAFRMVSAQHCHSPCVRQFQNPRRLFLHRCRASARCIGPPCRRWCALAAAGGDSSAAEQQTAVQTTEQEPSGGDLACYGIGTEVECVLPEYPGGNFAAARSSGSAHEPLSPPSVLDTLLLISPFFFWGTSMVAMKQLGPHTTPLFLAAWRMLPAGVALLAWAHASGRKQPQGPTAWLAVSLFGLADGACFQGFLAEGLQRTSAGLGSVVIDSQPLSVALMASLLFGERLGGAGVAGLVLGVAGLALLEVPQDLVAALPGSLAGGGVDLTAAAAGGSSVAGWSIWDSGEWWMLLAAQSMAVGTIMVRWVAKYCDPVVATGWHMILGGVPLAALAAAQEGGEVSARLAHATPLDGVLLAYVTLLGSAASYGVFFYEATVRGNLTSLSSLTFLTPMFAAAGGWVLLGETLTPLQLIGATVTLGAVALINSATGSSKGAEGGSAESGNGGREGSSGTTPER